MKKLILGLSMALTAGFTGAQADGDATKGERIYKRCKACHTLEAGKNRVGPSLAGIIGKTAASDPKFKYSKAMKESGWTWDEETLKIYLKNPRKALKGNRMSFPGLRKEADIDNLIAFLKQH